MPMKIPGVAWRSLTGYDMPAVEKIAATVHPNFFESLEVLAERQRLYFHGTYLLEVNERPAGYVLSHPWRFGDLRRSTRCSADCQTMPIPTTSTIWRCCRWRAASAPRASSPRRWPSTPRAHGFPTMSLVAVNGSQGSGSGTALPSKTARI